MTDKTPKSDNPQATQDPKAERQDRLNAALRANLQKRKHQTKARKSPETVPESDGENAIQKP